MPEGHGELQEAESILRVVELQEAQSHFKDSPQVLDTSHELANCLLAQGKILEAEKKFREVEKSRGKKLGPGHQDTLNSLAYVGACLLCKKSYEDAVVLYRTLLARAKNEYPDDSCEVMQCKALLHLVEVRKRLTPNPEPFPSPDFHNPLDFITWVLAGYREYLCLVRDAQR